MIKRLTVKDLTRLAIGVETAVVLESDLNALEQAKTDAERERDEALTSAIAGRSKRR